MKRIARAPAGSSPDAVGLPTPADPVLPACGLVMSSVERIAIVAKTMPKFVHYDLNGPDRFREATTIVNSVDDDPAPATP